LTGVNCIFFADQNTKTEVAPGKGSIHAASGVSLDHGIDAGGFEHTLSKARLSLRSEGLHQNEFATVHGVIIRLDAITNLGVDFKLGEVPPREERAGISQNRSDSEYNSRLGLRG
jgi:hypothetical protein